MNPFKLSATQLFVALSAVAAFSLAMGFLFNIMIFKVVGVLIGIYLFIFLVGSTVRDGTKTWEKRRFRELADPNHPRQSVLFKMNDTHLTQTEIAEIAAEFGVTIVRENTSESATTYRVDDD